MLLRDDGFEVTSGEPVLGALKTENQHFYCPNCKTWLFTRPKDTDLVNLRSVLLNDAGWVAPIMETGTADRLPFAETGAEFSFESFPDLSKYPQMVQAFSDHGARPG